MSMFGLGMTDLKTLNLMSALGEISREERELGEQSKSEPTHPMGLKQALLNELIRRQTAHRIPFDRTMTTLLGQDALLWLTTASGSGVAKLQPHEFSRTGWRNLWAIDTQLEIEQELLGAPPEIGYLAKIVVALCWTLAALASFISPAVFFGETTPHLSSEREGQYTVSVGRATHTLVDFRTDGLMSMVLILAEGLTNPLLSAADLMWMGAALARVREVHSGHREALPMMEEQFDLFLSHRGRDAKRSLSGAVQTLRPASGVFLDCLTLPRGMINRNFIYSSLARSKEILIVDTENFNESEWCRKEAWFAGLLTAHRLAGSKRVTLSNAIELVKSGSPKSARGRPSQKLSYPIASRVLRDVDYWARKPNLHSLREAGLQRTAWRRFKPQSKLWIIPMIRSGSPLLAKLSAIPSTP